MSTPVTPTKTDNAIREIANTITAKWGLQFPPLDIPRSPLEKDRGRSEEKVLSRLQYLYFHDKKNENGAIDWAISNFEQYALQAHSQWVTKPNADIDVLPRRGLRSESTSYRNSLSKKAPLSAEMTDDLMRGLLHFLDIAFKGANKGLRYDTKRTSGERGTASDATSVYTTPKSKRALESQRSPRKSSSHQPKIREYLLPLPSPAGSTKDVLEEAFKSSSDAFNCSSDCFDELMIDAPAKTSGTTAGNMEREPFASTWEPDQPDEEFKTPPESPSHLRSKRLEINKVETAMGPPASNRKRTFPETAHQPQPRKMSREKSISAGLLGDSPSSAQTKANDPRKFSLPIPSAGLNTGSLHKAQSTDSLRSFATSGISGPISTSTSVWRSANTSANTSFDASTAATSFSCSGEPAELDGYAMLDSRISDVCEPDWFLNGDFGSHLKLDPDAMEYNCEAPMKAKTLPIGPPQQKPSRVSQLLQQLISKSPFAPFELHEHCSASFRQLYETIRVAGNCGLPLNGFTRCLRKNFDDYEELWSSLASIVKSNYQTLPEKSKPTAWAMAAGGFDNVLLSGSLQYVDQPREPIFRLSLKPLRLERSYRMSRKFGNDRFFVLEIPGLDNMAMPAYLKLDQEEFYEAAVQWFASHEHKFLGRKWRAFCLKPEDRKKSRVGKASESTFNEPRFRVYFFAIEGYDFRNENSVGEDHPRLSNHTKSTVRDLIDWFMPASENRQILSLKFFARLALAVSPTTPTIEFKPFQIVKTRDAINISPTVRSFQTDKMPLHYQNPEGAVVMNDGCSRISKAAARAISEMLGLDDVPCVFQGRIGGAKGMWMVDALDEEIEGGDGLEEFWIEVTAEQLKFEPHPIDRFAPDPRRVTFEVNTYARKLLPSSLNFQLMPILVDRGVPYEVFATLVEEDLTAKAEGLAKDMENPLDVLRWNKETAAAVEEKTSAMGVEMIGAVPNSTGDRIKWFIESGFHPTSCRFFKDILYKQASAYCLRLENKMNIGLGRSTSALMIADPLAVLEQGEVHLGFSSVFNDRKSGWSDIMLHDMDVLVARSPALLPSDIQKVRAVFNPQLRMYRDVVVFSSKGSQSLASKLSGGDYDGDRAWVCWDPAIVNPFTNVDVPFAPSLSEYNISKDTTKVEDFHPDSRGSAYIDQFLTHAFRFNLRTNLLGSCTIYHEKLCYRDRSISTKAAIDIAHLLGSLVDRGKAGIVFTEDNWIEYLTSNGLPLRLNPPAYKAPGHHKPTSHIIDRLLFEVVRTTSNRALANLHDKFKDVGTYDDDLVYLGKSETEAVAEDPEAANVIKEAKKGIKAIHEYWRRNNGHTDEDFGRRFGNKKKGSMSFNALVQRCCDDFLALPPVLPPHVPDAGSSTGRPPSTSPTIAYWERQHRLPGGGSWSLLKASLLFAQHHRSDGFCWYVAGRELGELKATARGRAGYRTVVKPVHEVLRVDNKAIERVKKRGDMMAKEGGGLDDNTGEWIGEDGVEDEGMESQYGDWAWTEEILI